ncbi:hypothetical protein ACP4OV_006311 [Aristida adscensionis]
MRSSPARAPAGDVDVELLKAVAQAWHAQSGNPRPSRAPSGAADDGGGAGTRRGAGAGAGAARHRPSRFKLEAMAAAATASASAPPPASTASGADAPPPPPPRERTWDFGRSLWDTYELVAVARKLESGLVLAEHTAAAAPPPPPPLPPEQVAARGTGRRTRESARSLRSLLLRSSSRTLDASDS